MKVGDLVRTKVPGFGTGKTARIGTVINPSKSQPNVAPAHRPVQVMHEDGTFREWYPWQLEILNVTRTNGKM